MRITALPYVLSLIAVSASHAAVYVVRPDGTGDFPTIQAAISASVSGDIIEMTNGTYTGDGNRDIDYLGKSITIKSQSSEPSGCILDSQGSHSDPHYGIGFQNQEGAGAVLEGVTVNGAYPLSGIRCVNSSPTIRNCVVSNNTAEFYGGGAYCSNASPTFTNCIFTGNDTGISGWGFGGGAFAGNCPVATFVNCTFSDNHSPYESGALGADFSVLNLIGCTIVNNHADVFGGVGCRNGTISLTDCFLEGNIASSGGGGGLGFVGSSGTVRDCVMTGNEGLAGGAILCAYGSSPEIVGCVLFGNTGNWRAGAVDCYDGCRPTLLNCTIFGNAAGAEGGGGLFCWQSSPVLRNTIIASSSGGEAVGCNGNSSPTLICSDLHANAGGDWTGPISGQLGINGNISEDPLFCGAPNRDFSLQDESPCAPEHNASCGLIGAEPVGCWPTPMRSMTWGKIKAMFRD
jgi:hypothetical protein